MISQSLDDGTRLRFVYVRYGGVPSHFVNEYPCSDHQNRLLFGPILVGVGLDVALHLLPSSSEDTSSESFSILWMLREWSSSHLVNFTSKR